MSRHSKKKLSKYWGVAPCSYALTTCFHTNTHTHTPSYTTCWSRNWESPYWLKPNSGEQLNQIPAFDHLVMWTWQVTIWLIKCKWQLVLKVSRSIVQWEMGRRKETKQRSHLICPSLNMSSHHSHPSSEFTCYLNSSLPSNTHRLSFEPPFLSLSLAKESFVRAVYKNPFMQSKKRTKRSSDFYSWTGKQEGRGA